MKPSVARLSPLLFLSGGAALILEVAWFRRLAQLAGGTSVALGAVIASVIGGMAVGAWLLGRRADRTEQPLRLYALLEVLVAGAALLSPWLLDLSQGGFTALERALGDSPRLHAPATFLLASLLLALPSIAMGGTLPAAASALAATSGRSIGLLYSANTLGGVAGTLAAGFLLLPTLGLAGTMRIAAMLSALAGTGALLVRAPRAPQISTTATGAPRAILLYAISGFLGLAAEVCFTRSLVLVFGSTTYAFSVMLSVLLLGIGLGGALGARSKRDPMRTLELTVVTTAAVLSLSMLLVPLLPRLYLARVPVRRGGLCNRVLLRFALAATVLLPGAIGLGYAFPLAASLAGSTGAGTGRLYAWNTVASVAGSTTAVFLLVPVLGPERGIALIASGVALVVFLLARRPAVLAPGLLACCGWIPPPEVAQERLLAGIYFNPSAFLTDGAIDERSWEEGVDIAWTRHGRDTTISIWRWYGRHSLLVDGKAEASDQVLADDHHLSLLGHLPMLAHPDPKRVLVVGLGMGTTLRAVQQHAPTTLRVVEIEPAVVEAARWLGRAPPEVTIADARTWLRATDERFDVITSDPIHPSVRGSGDLYTREYWESCRDRLATGGVVCHWLPVYQMGVNDLRAVLATFSRVFQTAVYFGGGDLVLLGAVGDLPRPPRPLKDPVAGLESDLSRLLVTQLATPCDGEMLTEDRLYLEFSTPKQVHQTELASCFEWVRDLWGAPPEPYATVLDMEIAWAKGGGDALAEGLTKSLEEHPEHPFVRRFAGELFLDWAAFAARKGDIPTAEGMLRRARVYLGDDPRITGTEGDHLAAQGDREGAAARFRELIERFGESRYLRRRIAALGKLPPTSFEPVQTTACASDAQGSYSRWLNPFMEGKTSKGEQTREHIVETALRLFRERGYDETTMRAVAEEAGVSLGNAYYYFKSKEHLLHAYYRTIHAAHLAAAEPVLAREKGLRARLLGVLKTRLEVIEPYHRFSGLLFRTAADPKSPLNPFHEDSREDRLANTELFARVLEGSDRKFPRDIAPRLPALLWTYSMGIVLFWIHDESPGRERTHRLVERSVDIVVPLLKMISNPLLRPLRKAALRLLEEVMDPEGPPASRG